MTGPRHDSFTDAAPRRAGRRHIPRAADTRPQPTALDTTYRSRGFARNGRRFHATPDRLRFQTTRGSDEQGCARPARSRRTDNAVIIDRNGMGSAVGDVDNDGDLDVRHRIFGGPRPW